MPDPSKGAAPGVVKDSGDRDIEGKLELLKVTPGKCMSRAEYVLDEGMRKALSDGDGCELWFAQGSMRGGVAQCQQRAYGLADLTSALPNPTSDAIHPVQGIDFCAEPCSLTALMGGSGAGKTVRRDGRGIHAWLSRGIHAWHSPRAGTCVHRGPRTACASPGRRR